MYLGQSEVVVGITAQYRRINKSASSCSFGFIENVFVTFIVYLFIILMVIGKQTNTFAQRGKDMGDSFTHAFQLIGFLSICYPYVLGIRIKLLGTFLTAHQSPK